MKIHHDFRRDLVFKDERTVNVTHPPAQVKAAGEPLVAVTTPPVE